MTPSWYDVLGVEPDADAEAIRAAFKGEIADLDPTDRRFRLASRAAEVLLDPVKRAAHDRDLAASDAEDEDGSDDVWVDAVLEPPVPVPGSEPELVVADTAKPRMRLRRTKPGSTAEPDPTAEVGRPARRGPSMVVVAGLGLLALVLVAATVLSFARSKPDDGLPDARQVAAARAAAEAAVVPVLSYDYRHLDEDLQTSLGFLTPAYADELNKLYASVIEENAPANKTVVKAKLLASGVTRTGAGRVDVVVFVDQVTTNSQVSADKPDVYKNQAVARMVETDGSWLLDCLVTDSSNGECDR